MLPPVISCFDISDECPRVCSGEQIQGKLLDARDTSFTAVVRDGSSDVIGLSASLRLPVAAPLQLQYKGVMFLGEVIHCAPSAEGYIVRVQLLQYLDPSKSVAC